jgi:S-methyl-5-thioribose-1-phosphate isomerase
VDLTSNTKTKTEIEKLNNNKTSIIDYITKKIDYLKTSRPTAVNLFNAMDELANIMKESSSDANADADANSIITSIVNHAEFMLQRDVNDNKAIGSYGADAILSKTNSKPARVVTICNTGSLATSNYGTALGVARALQERNMLSSIHCLETRPYNQGSRLTAFEIMEEKMPNGTLICDSACAALMRTVGVDACVVGADRCCKNGDTANKIGTFMLAVVAYEHNVPFYIASPFTTLDVDLENGDCIEIEERPAEEMIESSRAPKGMKVWNPAFDVTPAKYITGIITEKGIIEKEEDGTFDVVSFV